MNRPIDGVRITLHCIITYYQPSGKMYTTHEWYPKVRCFNMGGMLVADWHEACAMLKNHLMDGQRPGLIDCDIQNNEFLVALRPHDGCDHGCPIIIWNPLLDKLKKTWHS